VIRDVVMVLHHGWTHTDIVWIQGGKLVIIRACWSVTCEPSKIIKSNTSSGSVSFFNILIIWISYPLVSDIDKIFFLIISTCIYLHVSIFHSIIVEKMFCINICL
jgi:hypothetical protein